MILEKVNKMSSRELIQNISLNEERGELMWAENYLRIRLWAQDFYHSIEMESG